MSASTICTVCTRQYAQYTCPRCNTQYCSLTCYKNHGEKCTQDFYSQNAKDGLQGIHSQKEDRKAIEQVVKNIYAKNWDGTSPSGSDDSDGSESDWIDNLAEEELQKIIMVCNSDHTLDIESILPEATIKKFQQEAHRGGLHHLIIPWEPWWKSATAASVRLSATGTALMGTRGSDPASNSFQSESSSPGSEIPAPLKDRLPPVRDLLKGEVSPNLRWHLVDLVYCYCFTVRQYNGDVLADVVECSERALDLSICLSSSQPPPESRKEGIAEILQKAMSGSFGNDRGFAIFTLKDVQHFCEIGRAALLLALNDLKNWLELASAEIQEGTSQKNKIAGIKRIEKCTVTSVQEEMKALQIEENVSLPSERGGTQKREKGVKGRKQAGRKLQFAVRKIWFIMAWANEQDRNWYECLGDEIHLSLEELAATIGGKAQQQTEGAGTSVKIEEL